jgi:sterol desaturase/sphingolipid hydroxylase (fatty acid hydroxylase superfamily)
VITEPVLRLAAFFGVFAVLAVWEVLAPRRGGGQDRSTRWPINLGLSVLNTLVLRIAFPAAAAGAALWANASSWGLFNQLAVPGWLAAGASIILLDLAVYGQHRLSHAAPWLWRVHRLHHIDPEVDVTTAGRFHPIEMVLSMVWKVAVVVALGAPAEAVLAFEILLNAAAMFSHARIALPAAVDRRLRLFLVTPDMHRVHHSIHRDETDSNYGFLVSLWDRLLGSYRDQPRDGHETMVLGVEGLSSPRARSFVGLLLGPFRRDQAGTSAS